MSYYFNADEVFRIGVEIEENGKVFYEAGAAQASEPAVRELCRKLAAWETKHVELFEELRRKLPPAAREGSAFDPDSEEGAYIKATADTHVFLRNKDVGALVRACGDGAALLDLAIAFEKDSVVFYSAMKPLVAKHLGQGGIDALIEEELRHIGILTIEKEKLGRKA